MPTTKRPVGRPRSDVPKPPTGLTVSVRGIDPEFWAQARAQALIAKMSIGELVNFALAEYLGSRALK